jgi:integrase
MGRISKIKEGTKTVRPFELDEIQRLVALLQSKNHGKNWMIKRDIMLVTFACNTGLRMMDLVNLTVDRVSNLPAGDEIVVTETKTKKPNTLVMTPAMRKSLDDYLRVAKPAADEPLFKSRKGGPLRSDSVGDIIVQWAKELKLSGKFGTHSLRKSWGLIQRKVYGTDLGVITKAYNHSSPATTMRYLGLTDKEVKKARLCEIVKL